jgi:hypothetical protein
MPSARNGRKATTIERVFYHVDGHDVHIILTTEVSDAFVKVTLHKFTHHHIY